MRQIIPLNRTKATGPDHHIWDNNGTWWAHFSITRRRGPSKRVRLSLCTKNVDVARERRDQLMRARPDEIDGMLERWRADNPL